MNPRISLRIAAVLMLLHTAGHTIGALTWKTGSNAILQHVVDAMLNNHFQFMGTSVSMGDFYSGYGYSMTGVLLLVSILLWLLSTEPNRRFILLLGLFLLFLGTIEWIWFFPFAAAFSLLAGVATLLSLKRS